MDKKHCLHGTLKCKFITVSGCIHFCTLRRTRQHNGVLPSCAKGPHEVQSTTRAAEMNATSVLKQLLFLKYTVCEQDKHFNRHAFNSLEGFLHNTYQLSGTILLQMKLLLTKIPKNDFNNAKIQITA